MKFIPNLGLCSSVKQLYHPGFVPHSECDIRPKTTQTYLAYCPLIDIQLIVSSGLDHLLLRWQTLSLCASLCLQSASVPQRQFVHILPSFAWQLWWSRRPSQSQTVWQLDHENANWKLQTTEEKIDSSQRQGKTTSYWNLGVWWTRGEIWWSDIRIRVRNYR